MRTDGAERCAVRRAEIADSEDVIAHRLSEYDAETARLVDALSDWGEVVAIDGARPVEAVTTEIVERLRTSHAR